MASKQAGREVHEEVMPFDCPGGFVWGYILGYKQSRYGLLIFGWLKRRTERHRKIYLKNETPSYRKVKRHRNQYYRRDTQIPHSLSKLPLSQVFGGCKSLQCDFRVFLVTVLFFFQQQYAPKQG